MVETDYQETSRQYKEVLRVFTEFYIQNLRNESVVHVGQACPDGRRAWVQKDIEDGKMHDSDYMVFMHFQDPQSVIIDAGAHFGYSSVSIWASGCKTQVLSFEPNQIYADPLLCLRLAQPQKFDFSMIGLSADFGTLRFAAPVLNGVILGAFCTAVSQPKLDAKTRQIMRYLKNT